MAKKCNTINDGCSSKVGPDYGLNKDGSKKDVSKAPTGCQIDPRGGYREPRSVDYTCTPFNIENDNSNIFIDDVVNEAISIAGATFNVHKLLGLKERVRLVDCTGRGKALSNGDLPNFPADNAFDLYQTEWRSLQSGNDVIVSAYLGYDFGSIKTKSGRDAYGIETDVFKHITAITLKQSDKPERRATRIRLEYSQDGKQWFGAGTAIVPDDDCANTITFKDSVPARYWRIRPLDFNGVDANERWAIKGLQMHHNYVDTHYTNIEDKVLLENRNREYDVDPTPIKAYYEISESIGEVSIFGLETPSFIINASVSFSSCVALLGRSIIVGDIIEIPAEMQFTPNLERVLRYMEVTDVSWDLSGYTPGWKPTLLKVVMQPAMASQETQDIFGDLRDIEDEVGSVTNKNDTPYQDYNDVDRWIEAEAKDNTPELGADASNTVRAWEEHEIEAARNQGIELQKIGLHSTGLYVEDALPPNDEPYTEGDNFPDNPNDGDYHRLTYNNVDRNIPARLYRYSKTKGRWIYLETDKRDLYDPYKPVMRDFLNTNDALTYKVSQKYRNHIKDDCPPDEEN